MGADGGIDWLRIKGGKTNIERFKTLVGPLGFLWKSSRSEHNDYLYEHPLPEDYVVSTYGTDHRYGGMRELVELIHYLEYTQEETDWFWQGASPLDFTWEGLLADYMTNPNQELKYQPYYGMSHGWGTPLPAQIMWDEYHLWFDPETLTIKDRSWIKEDHILRKMLIKDWLLELQAMIDFKSLGWAETWT